MRNAVFIFVFIFLISMDFVLAATGSFTVTGDAVEQAEQTQNNSIATGKVIESPEQDSKDKENFIIKLFKKLFDLLKLWRG